MKKAVSMNDEVDQAVVQIRGVEQEDLHAREQEKRPSLPSEGGIMRCCK